MTDHNDFVARRLSCSGDIDRAALCLQARMDRLDVSHLHVATWEDEPSSVRSCVGALTVLVQRRYMMLQWWKDLWVRETRRESGGGEWGHYLAFALAKCQHIDPLGCFGAAGTHRHLH
jgi:hypothetical protein